MIGTWGALRHVDPVWAASIAAAATDPSTAGGGISPTITLVLGFMTLLGLTIAPIAVAYINKGSPSKSVDLSNLPADIVMPRKQYDELLDWFARADQENDRLSRDVKRLREQLDAERLAHAHDLARLGGGRS